MNSGPLSPLGFCSHNVCLVPSSLSLALFSPRILVSMSQKDPVFDSEFLLSSCFSAFILLMSCLHFPTCPSQFSQELTFAPQLYWCVFLKKRVAILVLHFVVPDFCREALRAMPNTPWILSSSELPVSNFWGSPTILWDCLISKVSFLSYLWESSRAFQHSPPLSL